MLLTDVDHFKSVNDTHGHPIGDQVLKGVAQILREKARDTDLVARYGGEEFAVIMPETDGKGALVIAERIREAVQAKVFQTELGPLQVTISVGIAAAPANGVGQAGAHRPRRPVPLLRQAQWPEPLGAAPDDGVGAAVGVSRRSMEPLASARRGPERVDRRVAPRRGRGVRHALEPSAAAP